MSSTTVFLLSSQYNSMTELYWIREVSLWMFFTKSVIAKLCIRGTTGKINREVTEWATDSEQHTGGLVSVCRLCDLFPLTTCKGVAPLWCGTYARYVSPAFRWCLPFLPLQQKYGIWILYIKTYIYNLFFNILISLLIHRVL